MRILSNNIWKCDENQPAWAEKGEDCSAQGRVDGLVRAYLQAMPQVIALQECSEKMAMLLTERLRRAAPDARYTLVTGGDTPLLYRAQELTPVATGFLRFPENIPGMEGCFNNFGTKSYAWGVFDQPATGKRLSVMSVHLWWMSSHPEDKDYYPRSNEARAWQIRLAMAEMQRVAVQYDCPALIAGDYNASVTSLCLDAVRAAGWQEVHDLATEEKDETRGHHNCYGWGYTHDEPGTFAQAIDHIILKAPCPVTVQRFCRIAPDWYDCISDHYPLYTDIQW